MNSTKHKKIIIFSVLSLSLVLIIGLVLIYQGNQQSGLQSEILEEGQTEIQKSEDLRTRLNTTQIALLSDDINTFGESTLQDYKTSEEGIVFEISSKIKPSNAGAFDFDGKFIKTGTKVNLRVKTKANDRLSVSITNPKTKENIDSKLPSNSQKNQFIATLPVVTENYGFYYYQDTKKLSIEVSGAYTAELRQIILDDLKTRIGKDSLSQDDYDLYYTPPSIEGAGSSTLIKDTNYPD